MSRNIRQCYRTSGTTDSNDKRGTASRGQCRSGSHSNATGAGVAVGNDSIMFVRDDAVIVGSGAERACCDIGVDIDAAAGEDVERPSGSVGRNDGLVDGNIVIGLEGNVSAGVQ